MADIPAGTGLGSSGAFAVGTLNALYMYKHQNIDQMQLAAQACHIEMNILNEPVGKQDQYIAATGGIKAFTFRDDESVLTEELNLQYSTRVALEENLVLFYTGVRRSASEVLTAEQVHASKSKDEFQNNLSDTREIGYQTRETLLGGKLNEFGALLTDQWQLKYRRQPTAQHDTINEWIECGIQAGALGGKLVGAGGGGFLLFYAPDKTQLRIEMLKFGLVEVPFDFDYEGTSIVATK
jgi:D-glycero-alpha-D-manno-heptose-7-phosphate kinase